MPTALDLAIDPETDITDQNHIGGLATVIQLAQLAQKLTEYRLSLVPLLRPVHLGQPPPQRVRKVLHVHALLHVMPA